MPKMFSIHLEVEELALGSVMHKLHTIPGVAKIALNMDKKPKAKANGSASHSKKFGETAEEFAMSLLRDGPQPARVLKDHFADVGRSAGSVSSALNTAQAQGFVEKAGNATWALTRKAKDRLRHKEKKD